LYNLLYRDRLISLKLDSLHVRRIKQDLIMYYKIINGLVAIDCSEFFSFADCDRTRGHYICRSVDVMSVNLALLEECVLCGTLYVVNACSVSYFKRELGTVNLDLYTC